ncbi:hypothetical protein [Marinobacterium lutimaris]|uniref:Uncharacterized protein n=1 Tax=Marinobacterium lutimaris TaxID=568106 RepID=A0A1H5YBS4_9GAMM|nr:hypothetical protein [Marinobacterium lutimaris]SEG21212.1 hypothetical protein SAMN05444390_1011688 [Marinobacterium lutimaris]
MIDLNATQTQTLKLLEEHGPCEAQHLFQKQQTHTTLQALGGTLKSLRQKGLANKNAFIGGVANWYVTATGGQQLAAADKASIHTSSDQVGMSRAAPAAAGASKTPADLAADFTAASAGPKAKVAPTSEPAIDHSDADYEPTLEAWVSGTEPVQETPLLLTETVSAMAGLRDVVVTTEERADDAEPGEAIGGFAADDLEVVSVDELAHPLPVIDSDQEQLQLALDQLRELTNQPTPPRNIHDMIAFNRQGAEVMRQRGGKVAASMMEASANALARFAGVHGE